MKTITKISVQKVQDRYNLFLDEAFFCGISEDTLIRLGLKKGMQVDEKELETILEEEERNKCLNYCMYLLARQNYFEKSIVDKLKQKEYSDEAINFALGKLKAHTYLDDSKLASSFVNDKKRFAKKGPKYIAQALRSKGVDYETIAKTIDENYSEEEAFENCMETAQKKIQAYKKKELEGYTLKNKMYTFLAQRGFSSQVISKVLEQMLLEE